MTILEFFERELQKCKNNLEHQMKHNAPASDIENLKNKVMYYETICKMLKGDRVEAWARQHAYGREFVIF